MNRIKKWIEEFEKEYIDPDGIKRGKNGYEYNNEAFYNEYKNLLENRNNKFELHFDPRNEPGLIMINKKNKEKFWLKSDQFGFSAPSSKLNHVYDVYLLKVLKLNDDQKLAEAKKMLGIGFRKQEE